MMKNPLVRRSAPGVPGPDPRIVVADGPLLQAVHALSQGLDLLTSDWPHEKDVEWPVYESGVQLAREVADVARRPSPATLEPGMAARVREHLERVAELAREYGLEPVPLDGYAPDGDALGRVSAMLREQAMEHHDAQTLLGTHQSGDTVLITSPVTVEQAHVWLLGPLYEKVESWVLEDPLFTLERRAAAWWLSRWRSARPLPGDDFARGVREQEFALVDRPLLGADAPAVEHMVDEGLLRRIGGRQMRMARGLIESVAGVWTVESRAGARAVFVDPLDGTRLEVREHATAGDNPYGAGFIALGRLIPFGDGTWLRSPGTYMMSYGKRSGELAGTLAEGLRQQVHTPAPAFLEATVHTLTGVRGLPRPVLPAPSPDDAAEIGRELMLLLREVGAARPADPSSLGTMQPVPGQSEALEFKLDVVLAEYVQAVYEQSRKSRAVRDARRRHERKARKKGGGRRR